MFSSKPFPAAVGFYRFLFLYFEPISLFNVLFVIFARGREGVADFYHNLAPNQGTSLPEMDPRSLMLVWQLSSLYILIGGLLMVTLYMLREHVTDFAIQERLFTILIAMMCIADLAHAGSTWFALPESARSQAGSWPFLVHGNFTIPLVICALRIGWFAGLGRGEIPVQTGGGSSEKQ